LILLVIFAFATSGSFLDSCEHGLQGYIEDRADKYGEGYEKSISGTRNLLAGDCQCGTSHGDSKIHCDSCMCHLPLLVSSAPRIFFSGPWMYLNERHTAYALILPMELERPPRLS
jgi:hypothetical protein